MEKQIIYYVDVLFWWIGFFMILRILYILKIRTAKIHSVAKDCESEVDKQYKKALYNVKQSCINIDVDEYFINEFEKKYWSQLKMVIYFWLFDIEKMRNY